MRSLTFSLIAVSGLLLGACETTPKMAAVPEPTYEQALNNTFNIANYNAIDELMRRYQPSGVPVRASPALQVPAAFVSPLPASDGASESMMRNQPLAVPVATLPVALVPASANNRAVSASAAPFIVATLVNIDQLEQSSTFGRLISEQVASRMTQLGFGVVELKVRNGVYMKRNEGEFLLTREIKEVASAHKAQAVIVGTYAESSTMVYVNLKLVNPANSMILSAYDYALPMDKQVRSMMRKGPY